MVEAPALCLYRFEARCLCPTATDGGRSVPGSLYLSAPEGSLPRALRRLLAFPSGASGSEHALALAAAGVDCVSSRGARVPSRYSIGLPRRVRRSLARSRPQPLGLPGSRPLPGARACLWSVSRSLARNAPPFSSGGRWQACGSLPRCARLAHPLSRRFAAARGAMMIPRQATAGGRGWTGRGRWRGIG